jgi:hypothetical protein
MPLLNYTTTVSVDRTIGEIHGMLVRAGARSIMTDYDDQRRPLTIAFLVVTPIGERAFRLPANVDAVFKVLTLQSQKGQVPRRFVTREQATRVGWRIVKDWVEAQLAIIESGMVTLDQVMLPYMEDRVTGVSLYEAFVKQQLALPAARSQGE